MSLGCQLYSAGVWTVQEVADRVGLPARRVRYYDRIGLAGPSRRSETGYRLYGAEDEGRLRFVRQARALGLSLDQVRELVTAAEAGCCGRLLPELDRILAGKIAELDRCIAEMGEFRQQLAAFREGTGGCGCTSHSAFCGCLDTATDFVEVEREP